MAYKHFYYNRKMEGCTLKKEKRSQESHLQSFFRLNYLKFKFFLLFSSTARRFIGCVGSYVLCRVQAVARALVKLLQELFRLMGQLVGHLHHQSHIVVTAHILISERRHTLAF